MISRVTDAVLDEDREWQSRALDRMYPIVIFDALRVKIRDADSRTVKNKRFAVQIDQSVARRERQHGFVSSKKQAIFTELNGEALLVVGRID